MNGCSHMAHLKPARLVDLAEGVEAEQSVPHLAECEMCRRALAELRATMAGIAEPGDLCANHVPEPSPLFWDHLSARVREAVAEEGRTARVGWLDRWLRARVIAPVLGGALALVVVGLVVRGAKAPAVNPIPSSTLPIADTASVPSLPPLEPLGAADDPALGLIEDYGTALGWDDMREEMAVVSHPGGTDEAVATLSAEERQELQRLLEEEMAQPSALGAS
jgi:hypothetical protein